MKTEVMLFVRDVPASSRFYQELLGARSGHGGSEYEMIVDGDRNLLLQLHHLDADEHPGVSPAHDDRRGVGVLVYIQVDDPLAVYGQALSMNEAEVVSEPRYVELAGHTEFIMRDRDGYNLAICAAGDRT